MLRNRTGSSVPSACSRVRAAVLHPRSSRVTRAGSPGRPSSCQASSNAADQPRRSRPGPTSFTESTVPIITRANRSVSAGSSRSSHCDIRPRRSVISLGSPHAATRRTASESSTSTTTPRPIAKGPLPGSDQSSRPSRSSATRISSPSTIILDDDTVGDEGERGGGAGPKLEVDDGTSGRAVDHPRCAPPSVATSSERPRSVAALSSTTPHHPPSDLHAVVADLRTVDRAATVHESDDPPIESRYTTKPGASIPVEPTSGSRRASASPENTLNSVTAPSATTTRVTHDRERGLARDQRHRAGPDPGWRSQAPCRRCA